MSHRSRIHQIPRQQIETDTDASLNASSRRAMLDKIFAVKFTVIGRPKIFYEFSHRHGSFGFDLSANMIYKISSKNRLFFNYFCARCILSIRLVFLLWKKVAPPRMITIYDVYELQYTYSYVRTFQKLQCSNDPVPYELAVVLPYHLFILLLYA